MKRTIVMLILFSMLATMGFGRSVFGEVATKGTGSVTIGKLGDATVLSFVAKENGNIVIAERHNELIVSRDAVEFMVLALEDANRIASTTDPTVPRRAEPFVISADTAFQKLEAPGSVTEESLSISAVTGNEGKPGSVYITIGRQIIALSAGDYAVNYGSDAVSSSKSEVVRVIERLNETLEMATTLSDESGVASWSEDVVRAYESLNGVSVAVADE